VYSIPDKQYIKRVAPSLELRKDARVVLGYVGIISDQDGVDHFVRMLHYLLFEHRCAEIRAVVVGDGPALAEVRQLASDLSVTEDITFTGYLLGEELLTALSTFDIGIIPDPFNEYNDKISMNKVFEYAALGLPIVTYNLSETRRLLGDVAEYAEDCTPKALARACLRFINDSGLRQTRGRAAKALAESRFNWKGEREKYLAAFERVRRRENA
jgi:glycosyltransferase involved in cell wall biosynthesis